MAMQRLNPGPIDGSVLTLQHQHRSSAIWNKMDRGILHCRRRGAFRKSMCNPDKRIKEHLVASGFYGLHLIQFIKLDHALITALAERWRQETHSFHLAVGEATVTLQDIAILTGLPIDGLPIVGTGAETMTAASICETYLGSLPPQHCIKGYCVKLAWLAETFASLPENADDTVVECYARAYILLLISGTLFSDRTQNWINLKYLNFLKDLKKAREYSWGSAGLALLYRELCRATSPEASDICGPLILLQLWAWERFPHMRPTRMCDPPPTPEGFPRGPLGYRWCAELSMRNISTNVLWVYRNQLDQQKEDQITWEPYDAEVMRQLPDYCLTGSHIWRSKCPLIYYGIVELHFPDRVLRQFGLRQKIPLPCDTLLSLHDIDRFGKTHVNWIEWHGEWISMWERRHDLVVKGKPSKHPMKKDDPYMLWYNRITRRFIGPLDDGPSQRYQEHGARYASMGQVLQNIVDQAKYASAVDDIATYKRLCQYIMTVGELEMNRYHGILSHRDEHGEASTQHLTAMSSDSNTDENRIALDLNGSGNSDATSSQATASHAGTSSSGSTQDSSGQSGSTEPDSGHSNSSGQRHSYRPSHSPVTASRPGSELAGHGQPIISQSLPLAPVVNQPAATTSTKSVRSWPGFTGQLPSDESPTEQSACSWPVASARKTRKSQAAATKASERPASTKPATDEPAADQPASCWLVNHRASSAGVAMTASEQVATSQAIEKQIATSQTSSGRRTVTKSKQGATTRASAKQPNTTAEGQANNKKRASKRKSSQPNNSQAPTSYTISFSGPGHYPMPFPMPPMVPTTTTPATSGALSSPMSFCWPYPMRPSMYPFMPPTPSQFKSGGGKKSFQAPSNAPEASKKKKHRKDKASKASKEKKKGKSPSHHSKKARVER